MTCQGSQHPHGLAGPSDATISGASPPCHRRAMLVGLHAFARRASPQRAGEGLWRSAGGGKSGNASPYQVAAKLALAIWGRASAADPPKNPSGCWCLDVFGGPGSGKKMLKFQDAFRRSILDTFWQFFTFFYRFFAARQARKYCNLQCFCAFGMKQVLLATC